MNGSLNEVRHTRAPWSESARRIFEGDATLNLSFLQPATHGIGPSSAPAPGMNAAPKIGIETNLTAHAGAAVKEVLEPNAGGASGEDNSGWRSVLEALDLRSQVCAPGTAGCGSSSIHDAHATPNFYPATVQPVVLDQLGKEAFPARKVVAPWVISQKTPTAVAIIIPKTVNGSASAGINLLRGRKFRIDGDAPGREKSELESGKGISAVSSVQVPEAPPEHNGAAPAPGHALIDRRPNSISTPQHGRQDTPHAGSVIHVSSASVPHAQEDFDASPADAKPRAVVNAASREAKAEPLPAERLREMDRSPDIASQQEATASKHATLDTGFRPSANQKLSGEAAATTRPATNSESRVDSVTKVSASTSISERITKSALKTRTDTVNFGTQIETTQATAASMPAIREAGEPISSAERLINVAHNSSRVGADPFAALDAERGAPAPTWIRAGAHHAEAGYLDPALGWIAVRADSVANTVHASLMPPSTDAAMVLGNHLSGLNSYLSEHHGGVITMDAPQDGRGGMDAREGDHPPTRRQQSAAREEPQIPATTVPRQAAVAASSFTSAGALAGGGRYISVLA